MSRKRRNATKKERLAWLRAKRDRMIATLGGACSDCGRTTNLQFDHRDGRDWDVRSVAWSTRIRLYEQEMRAGMLKLLCIYCNIAKGNPRPDYDPDEPF